MRFGPGGAAPIGRMDQDLNGDGLIDAVPVFNTHETGLASGMTQACLTGTVQNGNTELTVQGCDNVTVR